MCQFVFSRITEKLQAWSIKSSDWLRPAVIGGTGWLLNPQYKPLDGLMVARLLQSPYLPMKRLWVLSINAWRTPVVRLAACGPHMVLVSAPTSGWFRFLWFVKCQLTHIINTTYKQHVDVPPLFIKLLTSSSSCSSGAHGSGLVSDLHATTSSTVAPTAHSRCPVETIDIFFFLPFKSRLVTTFWPEEVHVPLTDISPHWDAPFLPTVTRNTTETAPAF